jgi:two-component system, NtrC family, nitrogen regulation sensor histidine kinase NtrY
MRWARRVGLAHKLGTALVLAAILAGLATYLALTENALITAGPDTLFWLLNLDLALLLVLGAVVALRVVALVSERRRGAAGSRLHVRLVAVFSVLAITPAILVASFSVLFFYFGVEAWFSDRVRTVVNESRAIARSYLDEHQRAIRADALAMAGDLNRQASTLIANPLALNQFVRVVAAARGLPEAVVVNGDGQVIARSAFAFSLEFEPVTDSMLDRARAGEVVLVQSDDDDRVRALVKLDAYLDAFLFVGRLVEPTVIGALERTEVAVDAYNALELRRANLQITMTLIFAVVALLLLLAAVWAGLQFANRLTRPLADLIEAAERVRGGDLTARVRVYDPSDELGSLSRSFNRMTGQLQAQRTELMDASRKIDQRRRFTEAVLKGVSAGVLSLDREGRVQFPNRSAAVLLAVPADRMIGRALDDLAPEFRPTLEQALAKPGRPANAQVELRRDETVRVLHLRVIADADVRGAGVVATFDDITELVSAQRKAAWADVARRIAHEIKNPLTPIQLAAERLKRRYLKEITSDPTVFEQCTDTIVRQVDDLRRMVDEFSAFARMPDPVMTEQDLRSVFRVPVTLQQQAHPDADISYVVPDEPVVLSCDERQLTQALTNLLQNALDAIEGRDPPAEGQEPLSAPQIRLVLSASEHAAVLTIEDNGRGLPQHDRHRLMEPYVTTRAKGTGLGLAIVKKILEDHYGEIRLEDRDSCGARVTLVLPFRRDTATLSSPQ